LSLNWRCGAEFAHISSTALTLFVLPVASKNRLRKPGIEMPSKDEMLGSRTGCNDHCVGHPVLRRQLNYRGTSLLVTTALVGLTALAPRSTQAQDATWLLNPATHNFNTATNWNPATVPTSTAFFGLSAKPTLEFSANTTIGGWTFNAGASAYSFNNNHALTFNGAGIVINGGSAAITNTSAGFVNFNGNNGTAANASITNNGILNFNLNSTAGNAVIANKLATNFNTISTAGSAAITNNVGGTLRFNDTASGDGSLITNHSSVFFQGASTAGGATINNIDGTVSFSGTSTAGNADITNDDNLNFNDTSRAGNATITNGNFGSLNFNSDSSAGNAIITNNNNIFFESASTAGSAAFTNKHNVFFSGNSTAGNAAITNALGALVDFSGSTGPAGDRRLSAGSIAGAGSFLLGGVELTVGGNNLSTDVSGDISGTAGSLVKIGTGTLTLSGDATLGGTTIDGGALAVNGGALNVRNSLILGSTTGTSEVLEIGAGGHATLTRDLVIGLGSVGIQGFSYLPRRDSSFGWIDSF
jgi:fibronectin-binding autotransporter adhesin